MKTIQLQEPGKLIALDMLEPSSPGPGEALVRVHRIGVCGTDIHAFAGRQPFFTYPRILGHELGVEVIATGTGVDNVRTGDRCSVEPYLSCGECIACRRGKQNCCVNMRVLGVHLDGGMRERVVVPATKLHPSAALAFDQLALVETLAIGCHAVDRAQIQCGEKVLVIGAGPIGLSVIQFAVEKGATVIVLDINPERLTFCHSHMGVAHTINASQAAIVENLSDVTEGHMPTAVIDATGSARSMAASFGYPAHGGRLAFVGLFQGDVTFHDPEFHRKELTLLASRNALSADFPRIIELIEDGRIDTSPWITHRGDFDDVPFEFDRWTRPESGVIKAMITV